MGAPSLRIPAGPQTGTLFTSRRSATASAATGASRLIPEPESPPAAHSLCAIFIPRGNRCAAWPSPGTAPVCPAARDELRSPSRNLRAMSGSRKKLVPNSRISMVVISRNEGAFLRRTVENLQDTLPGDAEIVVVDDGSTDGSADCLAHWRSKRVRLYRQKGLGVAKSRNFGGNRTGGDILIFADAHLGLDAGWWR